MSEWQPIETAPKNERIDLYVTDNEGYGWRVTDCRWAFYGSPRRKQWTYIEDAERCPAVPVQGWRASHWMPLPAPPILNSVEG